MIYFLTGTNSYQIEQELRSIAAKTDAPIERIDVANLDVSALADLLRGQSLFAALRYIVLSGASGNTAVWNELADTIEHVSDSVTLAIVEPKPDRRTKAYKTIAKYATVIASDRWKEKDAGLAREWLAGLARKKGVTLSPAQIRDMVARSVVGGEQDRTREVDQWLLVRAVNSLKQLESIDDAAIATVLPPATSETVFALLDYAAAGKKDELQLALDELQLAHDPYQVFATISSQWSQLALLQYARDPKTATVLGVHPFVAQKLTVLSRAFSSADIVKITEFAATIDRQLKHSDVSPWEAVERLLAAIVAHTKTPA